MPLDFNVGGRCGKNEELDGPASGVSMMLIANVIVIVMRSSQQNEAAVFRKVLLRI
jgi:hypothetical protein